MSPEAYVMICASIHCSGQLNDGKCWQKCVVDVPILPGVICRLATQNIPLAMSLSIPLATVIASVLLGWLHLSQLVGYTKTAAIKGISE